MIRISTAVFPLLFLLLLTAAPRLEADNPGVVVVMTRGSGLANQIVIIHNDVPWTEIRARLAQHYTATSMSGSPGGWIVTIAQGARWMGQTLDGTSSALAAQVKINEEITKGRQISTLEFGRGRWIFSIVEPLGRNDQRVAIGAEFPREQVERLAAEGYVVTSLDYGGQEGSEEWMVLMTGGTGVTGQSIITGDEDFPLESVESAVAGGSRLTSVAYGDEEWVAILQNGTGLGEQKIFYEKSYPSKQIEAAWMAGYQITSIDWPTDGAFPTLAYNNLALEARLSDVPRNVPSEREWYENFVAQNRDTELGFVAVQRLAGTFVLERKWKEAADVYRKHSSSFPSMADKIRTIIGLLEEDDTAIINNLGGNVNTAAGEFMPVISADGATLFFTGMNRPGGFGGEDIFYSSVNGNDYTRAAPLRGQVNSRNHEFATAVAADESQIVLFSSRVDGYGRGDLYFSDKAMGGYAVPKLFPPPINSAHWDCDGFLTSDGKAMIFASDRPGAVGDFQRKDILYRGERWGNVDIWVSLKTANGWSEPINLGETINTPLAERSPFLHPDGKTLYFCSSGHPGLGKLDVFVTTRLREDSWTEWSEPVNLGKAINGIGSDWGYRVNTAGTHAYFAAEDLPGSRGGSDIYVHELPKSKRPQAVATIRGVVTDTEGNPLQVTIKWEDLSTGQEVGRLASDVESGKYFITLPLGKNYGYVAEKEGYYPVAKSVDLRNTSEGVDIEVNIQLTPIEKIAEEGMAVRLNNIFFDVNKSDLKDESKTELDRFASMLSRFPDGVIEISGHTDSVASHAYNKDLSQRRAQSVVDYLVSIGIEEIRLIARGYGEERPVADNGLDEGRALNRRVEFRFLKKDEIEALRRGR